MPDILEVIRKKKLASVKRSLQYSEQYTERVRTQALMVKALLSRLDGKEPPKETRCLEIAAIYYRMKDEYYAKRSVKLPSTLNKRSISFWTRVEKAIEETGVDPETYMRAQFQYFHTAFGRPPKLNQLATENAKMRARTAAGEQGTPRKVVGNDIRHRVGTADLFRMAEKQMRDVCEAQGMSREEVYEKLVIPGFLLFPKEYLKADPVYKEVCEKVNG